MGVTTKPAVTDATKATKVKVEQPSSYNLELASIKRYHYGNVLYVAETVYVFDEPGAKHMLALKDRGLPVFTLAKKRTKLVSVPVDQAEETIVQVEQTIVPKATNEKPPLPKGAIELDDGDPELRARLDAIDNGGGEIDTGAGVQVS